MACKVLFPSLRHLERDREHAYERPARRPLNTDLLYSDWYGLSMRLVDGVESALHLCVLLAALPRGTIPAVPLAEFHDLAPAATAKVLQQLAGAGVVEARPGRTGGYALARPAAEITVGEIVAAVGGSDPGFRCREIRRQGPCAGNPALYSQRCAIAQAMDEAERAWWQVLYGQTLADLGERVGAQVDDEIRARSRAWLQAKSRTS